MTPGIEQIEPVTAPGAPKNYPDAKELVTEDCIRPKILGKCNVLAEVNKSCATGEVAIGPDCLPKF